MWQVGMTGGELVQSERIGEPWGGVGSEGDQNLGG